MELNFFFTKKWVGGRSATQEYQQGLKVCPHNRKKMGIQGGQAPLAELEAEPRGLPLEPPKQALASFDLQGEIDDEPL